MIADRNFRSFLLLVGPILLGACSDQTDTPTGVADAAAQHNMHATGANVVPLTLEPFTFRAPLEPYKIQMLPDFMMHSRARSDIVVQRAVFAPGAGPWHTHPGPSFIYVIEGEIKLERFTRKEGCTETPVFTAGEAYFEVADEVHRAVVGASGAVLLVTRFNIPVGGAITIPAADPGC